MTSIAPLIPRKTPRQSRATATRDAIVEAAARILEADGMGGFNTNAIAARAGVSIGSLYQYFPAKDAILATLIRAEAEAFDAALSEGVRRAERLSLAGAIGVLAQVAVAHQTRRPRLARQLDLEEHRLGLEAELDQTNRRVGQILIDFLTERRLGDRAGHAAWDILHLSRGLIDGALERGVTEGLEARLTRAILGYLAIPPDRA